MIRTVLITGATDGIGLALARRYAADGERLVLHGRKPRAELTDPLFAEHLYVQADLSTPGAAAQIAACLDAEGIDRLDLLVHNAAMGSYGPIPTDPPERIVEMVQVNLTAPILLTRALAARLARAQGGVLFVGSLTSDLPCPDYAVYAATKAALAGFARSLHVEWKKRIRVQTVQPGGVRTGFHAKAGVPAKLVSSPRIPDAATVARALHEFEGGPERCPTVGRGNALLRWIARRSPKSLERVMRRARTKAMRR